jgi:hypothetical protein
MSTVLEPIRASKKSWQFRRQLQRRLAGIRGAMRAHLFWEGLAWTVAAVVGLAALSLLVDRWLRLELSSRLVLLAFGIAAVAAVAWRWLLAPLGLTLGDLDLAELLDRRLPGAGQRIANVLQLPELLELSFACPRVVLDQCIQDIDLAGGNEMFPLACAAGLAGSHIHDRLARQCMRADLVMGTRS